MGELRENHSEAVNLTERLPAQTKNHIRVDFTLPKVESSKVSAKRDLIQALFP